MQSLSNLANKNFRLYFVPKILRIGDAEVVGYRITKPSSVLGDLSRKKSSAASVNCPHVA